MRKEQAGPIEEPAEMGTVNIDDLGTSAQEQDDAVAWLESLAAKHGAKPEELVTDPNARKETAPEWVQKAAEAGSERAIGERPTAPPPEDLEELLQATQVEAEQEEVQVEGPLPTASMDETGMWLRDMGEEGGFAEEQAPSEEAGAPVMESGIPDWLREMEEETPQAEAAPTSGDEASLPDWLSEAEPEPTEVENVPSSWSEEETASESTREYIEKIDINSASLEQLAELPGIGDLLAQNIIAYREAYGEFSNLDDLSKIAGIGPSTLDDLQDLVEFREIEVETESEEEGITDWLRNVQIEAESPEAEVSEFRAESAEMSAGEDLPSWLAGLDEEAEQAQPAAGGDDDLPEWLRAEVEEKPAPTEPTTPSDWQPVEEQPAYTPEPDAEEPPVQAAPPSTPKPEPEETPVQAAPPPAPKPEPKPEPPTPPAREPYREPVTRSRSGMTGMLSAIQDPALTTAQNELTRGNIPGAMENYSKLIKKGKLLDEIIFDLREALYRYPVEVPILQTLGDAYMRANRLQEALDSYTKAEELLR